MHETHYFYDSPMNVIDAVGVFATLETANAKVMDAFQEHYGDVMDLNEDNFAEDEDGPDVNEVKWGIDKLGALSLEYEDGGDGDAFKFYILRPRRYMDLRRSAAVTIDEVTFQPRHSAPPPTFIQTSEAIFCIDLTSIEMAPQRQSSSSPIIAGDYPQYVKTACEAAGRAARQRQASSVACTSSSNPPVFIIMHEAQFHYRSEDNSTDIEAICGNIDTANAKVMEMFQKHHDGVVEEDNFFGEGVGADLNEVTWKIDSSGALSLEYADGAEGDVFKVYIETHELLM
ncbi:uncharacterized protein BDZ99DRAFT_528332 [Mytilinidion resinicola]|uniref:Uncharacterized protein n=1 Tax=Mytilinidion resinicola TaxID=574789 RepID=A0A6A6Y1B3_9PEZI|nr:uncharacterized protein BDZ99DRAFT_528332 [Mytilinidion resinicola]KAF2801607.1 hypothetical protein BDZ99DRAFT_528332 [Mytilinidion resinicola]